MGSGKYSHDEQPTSGLEDSKTKFDTGLSKVFRIHAEFQKCNYHSRANNLDMWHKSILNLYKEGYPKWNKKKKEHFIKTHEENEQKFNKLIKEANGMHNIINTPGKFGQAWLLLHKWELDTRYALDQVGLDMQDKEYEVY